MLTDKDIVKLAANFTQTLATKEDLKKLATKEDLKKLATKEDLKKLATKVDELDQKADKILEFADGIEETTEDHEKRLKQIEALPSIAHQLKK
ncbi:hypothetical protein HYS97_02870 [Candidatus Daviesbacteria bacterium]|nr:hypothetical protein [Candidatus Daviesbacteria bacterium]